LTHQQQEAGDFPFADMHRAMFPLISKKTKYEVKDSEKALKQEESSEIVIVDVKSLREKSKLGDAYAVIPANWADVIEPIPGTSGQSAAGGLEGLPLPEIYTDVAEKFSLLHNWHIIRQVKCFFGLFVWTMKACVSVLFWICSSFQQFICPNIFH